MVQHLNDIGKGTAVRKHMQRVFYGILRRTYVGIAGQPIKMFIPKLLTNAYAIE